LYKVFFSIADLLHVEGEKTMEKIVSLISVIILLMIGSILIGCDKPDYQHPLHRANSSK